MPFGVPYQVATPDIVVFNPHLLEQFEGPPLVVLNPYLLKQFAESPLANSHLLLEISRPSLVVLKSCRQAQHAGIEAPLLVVADPEPSRQLARRAERTFSWLAILAPYHISQEEIGDALEAIAAMERARCSTFKIMLKVCSTIFWAVLNGLRETIVAALASRESPK